MDDVIFGGFVQNLLQGAYLFGSLRLLQLLHRLLDAIFPKKVVLPLFGA